MANFPRQVDQRLIDLELQQGRACRRRALQRPAAVEHDDVFACLQQRVGDQRSAHSSPDDRNIDIEVRRERPVRYPNLATPEPDRRTGPQVALNR